MPIGKFFESVATSFIDFGKKVDGLDLTMSLDELLNSYGDNLDKIIIREEHDKKCTYLGGELRISCTDEKHYNCGYSLYFEDADESVHTVEAKSKPLEIKFLTEDFQRDLKKAGVLKFEIDEPSEETRLKYKQTLR